MYPKLHTFLTQEGWVQTDSKSYQLGFIFKTECDIYQIYDTNVHIQIYLRLVVSLAFQNLYVVITNSLEEKKLITPQNGQIIFTLYIIFLMLSGKKKLEIAFLWYLKKYDYLRNDSQTYEDFSFAKQS